MKFKNYEIRKATESDCKELAAVKLQVWETTYRGIYSDAKIDGYNYTEQEEKFKYLANSKDQHLYIATLNEKIVGYMCYGKALRPFKTYKNEIILFYILKEHQGQGLGRALFDFGYTKLKEMGTNQFIISCNKYNIPAQGFYAKMGGKLIHTDDDNENKSLPQVKFLYQIN
ncbi:MAG: GNAT family N-acetyltransferase [Clostridiales bacterium]|nr:GNAT family N-acetyltransferase [Clostridiales bacterium]